MTNRKFYSSNDAPYQPLSSNGKGPFFECDSTKASPHFHPVAEHPDFGPVGDMIVRQLHVPGYDQHDGRPTENFASMPDYHIITGWHVTDPNPRKVSHESQFLAIKKYPQTTDNEEAFKTWKEESEAVYGEGAVVPQVSKAGDTIYRFLPGKEQPEEQEEPEEEEKEEEEEQEEPEEQEQPEDQDIPLQENQRKHSIIFYPGKQSGDVYRPALSIARMNTKHKTASLAQIRLLSYADKLDMMSQMSKFNKSEEAPNAWEDLFKRSKKMNIWYHA